MSDDQNTQIRIKRLGHNIGLNTGPFEIGITTEDGQHLSFDLANLLKNIDRLRGNFRSGDVKNSLLSCLFSAHKEGYITPDDRHVFEHYVRDQISSMEHHEAARRLVVG